MTEQPVRPERHDMASVLDVRSNERVVVIATDDRQHPAHWECYDSVENARIGYDSVVIVDQFELTKRAMASITRRHPRLIAFVIASIDHERSIRRILKSLHPWAEVWDGEGKGIWTNLGKVILTPAAGAPYDRDLMPDTRLA